MNWLCLDTGYLDYAKNLEGFLLIMLPIVCSFTVAHLLSMFDFKMLSMFLIPVFMLFGFATFGGLHSSYSEEDEREEEMSFTINNAYSEDEEMKYGKKQNLNRHSKIDYVISSNLGYALSIFLLMASGLIYSWQRFKGILLIEKTGEDISALLMLLSWSNLLRCALYFRRQSWWNGPRSNFSMSVIIQMLVSLMVTLVCAQYKYSNHLSQILSMFIQGGELKYDNLWKHYILVDIGCLAGLGFSFSFYQKHKSRQSKNDLRNDCVHTLALSISFAIVCMGFQVPPMYSFNMGFGISLLVLCCVKGKVSTKLSLNFTNSYMMLTMYCFYVQVFYSVFPFVIGCLFMCFCGLDGSTDNFILVPGSLSIKRSILYVLFFVAGIGQLCFYFTILQANTKKRTNLVTESIFVVSILVLCLSDTVLLFGTTGRKQLLEDAMLMIFVMNTVIISVTVFLFKREMLSDFSCLLLVTLLSSQILMMVMKRDNFNQEHQLQYYYDALSCWFTFFAAGSPFIEETDEENGTQGLLTGLLNKKQKDKVEEKQEVLLYCVLLLPVVSIHAVFHVLMPLLVKLAHENLDPTSLTSKYTISGFVLLLWSVGTNIRLSVMNSSEELHVLRRIAVILPFIGGCLVLLPSLNNFQSATVSVSSSTYFSHLSSKGSSMRSTPGHYNLLWFLMVLLSLVLLRSSTLASSSPAQSMRGTTTKKSRGLQLFFASLLFGSGLTLFIGESLSSELSGTCIFLLRINCMFSSFYIHTSISMLDIDTIGNVGLSRQRQILLAWFSFLGLTAFSCSIRLLSIELFIIFVVASIASFGASMVDGPGTVSVQTSSSVVGWIALSVSTFCSYGVASIGVDLPFATILGLPISIVVVPVASLLLLNVKLNTSFSNNSSRRFRSVSRQRSQINQSEVSNRSFKERLHLCFVASLCVFVIASFCTITMRGFMQKTQVSHIDYMRKQGHSFITDLAAKFESNRGELGVASRLASCSFWTTRQRFVALKHLFGLIVGPTYQLISSARSSFSSSQKYGFFIDPTWSVLLNFATLLTCTGIDMMTASVSFSIVLSVYDKIEKWNNKVRSNMVI